MRVNTSSNDYRIELLEILRKSQRHGQSRGYNGLNRTMNHYRYDVLARIAGANRVFSRMAQNSGIHSIMSVLVVIFWLFVLACLLWTWGIIDLKSGVSSGN